MTTDELIAALSACLGQEPAGIVAAYLFGSFARGEQHAGSDVDLGVLFADPPAQTIDGAPAVLEGCLEQALRRPVQVISLNTAPADLVVAQRRNNTCRLPESEVCSLSVPSGQRTLILSGKSSSLAPLRPSPKNNVGDDCPR